MGIYLNSFVAAVSALTVGYLIYFDQRRCRDPKFRKHLRKQRQLANQVASQEASQRQREYSQISRDALAQLESFNEPLPTTPEAREAFFISQLKVAEDFMAKGPQYYEAAARCFFRVLQIYPDPMQLMMVFEQSLPQPVFAAIMDLMAMEMKTQNDKGQPTPSSITEEVVE